MNEELKRRVESLKAEKAAQEKSLERSRVRKDYRMVADLTERLKKLTEAIAELETEIGMGRSKS